MNEYASRVVRWEGKRFVIPILEETECAWVEESKEDDSGLKKC
jgi:hypothetical protein